MSNKLKLSAANKPTTNQSTTSKTTTSKTAPINPPIINEEQTSIPDEVSKYIKSLTEQEQKTLDIAKSHLGTSFNIKRSIGFLEWKAKEVL